MTDIVTELGGLAKLAPVVAAFIGAWALVQYRLKQQEILREKDKEELKSELLAQSAERKNAVIEIKSYVDSHVLTRKEVTDNLNTRLDANEKEVAANKLVLTEMRSDQRRFHDDITRNTKAVERLADKLESIISKQ